MSLVFPSRLPLVLPQYISYCTDCLSTAGLIMCRPDPSPFQASFFSFFHCLVLLHNGGGVEGIPLGELSLDLLDKGPQVGDVL